MQTNNVQQYDTDCASARLIEEGIRDMQAIMSRHDIVLRFILDAICSNPSDQGIVSYIITASPGSDADAAAGGQKPAKPAKEEESSAGSSRKSRKTDQKKSKAVSPSRKAGGNEAGVQIKSSGANTSTSELTPGAEKEEQPESTVLAPQKNGRYGKGHLPTPSRDPSSDPTPDPAPVPAPAPVQAPATDPDESLSIPDNDPGSDSSQSDLSGGSSAKAEELNQQLAALLTDRLTGSMAQDEFLPAFNSFRLSLDILERIMRFMDQACRHHQAGISPQDLKDAEEARKKIFRGQDDLVNRHRALIKSFINQKGKNLGDNDREDLEQEGYLGLLNATDRYNYRLGNCYMTFAYYRVRQNIDSSLTQLKNIRLPVNIMARIARMAIREKQLTQKLGRLPTSQELAAELELSLESVIELRRLKKTGTLSYDNKIKDFEDNDSYGETIADTSQKAVWELVNDEQNKQLIAELLQRLSPRARTVIELRYGFRNREPMTREEIGSIMGLSRERVRQIETTTLRRLLHNPELQGAFSGGEDQPAK